MPRSELFLGNLTRDVTQRDIEDIFEKYGKVMRCEVKNKGKRERTNERTNIETGSRGETHSSSHV